VSNRDTRRIIVIERKLFIRTSPKVQKRFEPVSPGGRQSGVLAWREVLVRSIPEVYGLFVRRGLNPGLAEELTQKTIFDAVAGMETFDKGRGKIESWLIGIAQNNLALEMRQRAKRPKANGDIGRYLEKIDSESLPDEILEREEMAELVRRAMDKLEAKERTVLRAKYCEDLSARVIAERMDITEKAVHSLLYRARISMREKLKNIRAV
jgi:RNA polymerase sigma-70 factor (ECF subfamily)